MKGTVRLYKLTAALLLLAFLVPLVFQDAAGPATAGRNAVAKNLAKIKSVPSAHKSKPGIAARTQSTDGIGCIIESYPTVFAGMPGFAACAESPGRVPRPSKFEIWSKSTFS